MHVKDDLKNKGQNPLFVILSSMEHGSFVQNE